MKISWLFPLRLLRFPHQQGRQMYVLEMMFCSPRARVRWREKREERREDGGEKKGKKGTEEAPITFKNVSTLNYI